MIETLFIIIVIFLFFGIIGIYSKRISNKYTEYLLDKDARLLANVLERRK